ncbi:MAG: VWA domain-containing protein [Burkholderiaceae bacterium]|nr:VWA domain-containing protein [Burkholderiaceae bacterium]
MQPAAGPHDRPYDALAGLPRGLWLPTLVTAAGTPAQRLAQLLAWRAALLAGELPPAALDFGLPDALPPLRAAIAELQLPALSRGSEGLADQLLRTLLWHLDRLHDLQPRLSRAQAIAHIAAEFRAAWTLLRGDWDEVAALLQGLGELHQLNRDALQGRLARREWAEARRLADVLQQLPELVALIRRLGRERRAVAPAPAPPQARPGPRREQGLAWISTVLPEAPGELRGIRLTGRIEQMLGSEAAMLRHPLLHRLWHARFAEGRLLGYDSQAVLSEPRPDPSRPPRAEPAPTPPQALERGPVILCLDTSGSMRGAPETLAKAVALQALRTAHAEGRGCRVIAFGGADEVLERELALSADGLDALLDLLGQSFDGGTDVQAPIERAIELVHQARWASADLLIVSDGEFGCTPATLARLDAAREQLGLRVQGVLVGDRETLGLMEVADDIFWVRDWRRHGPPGSGASGAQAGGFSPVHSKSLTALYFPNALSPRAARHRR